MATLTEILKAANVKDEVIAGLPAEVTTALTGYVAEADTKYQTAAEKEAAAAELSRQGELTKQEINQYVEDYGGQLNNIVAVTAERDALKTALESVKAQGIDIKIPAAPAAVVPGSPARGANAVNFDPEKFAGQVGTTMGEFLDANNEHIRLFGQPIPDSSTAIAQQARQARKPLGEFIAEKYKFSEARETKAKNDFQARIDAGVKEKLAVKERELAEKYGSNPNTRPGESSRNSFVPKIKSDDFHKSDGNKPRRERLGNMLDNIHKERSANQGV